MRISVNAPITKPFLILFFFILNFYCDIPAQVTENNKSLPTVNWAREKKIDVKHISLDLRFNWKKRQAYGAATITFSPYTTTDHISLDAAMLTIHSITLNGTIVKYVYDSSGKNDALTVTLNRFYKAGEECTINIEYHTNWINETDPNNIGGSNGKGIRFFQPSTTEPNRRKQIWSMSEPESNRYWFPCYDAPNDLRTTDFIATVENDLTVISNGELTGIRVNADGTKTFHYKQIFPYPNYKTSFVIGEYVDIQQTYGNIQLHNYGYPDEAVATKASVERLPDMMQFFADYTGVGYPYTNYSQVFVQEAPWGVGYNTMAIQSENMVDDDKTHADYLYLWDGLEAEALASQWFANYLFVKNWNDNWLARAFAHHFDGLYNEYKNGHDEYQLWYRIPYELPTYFGDWNAGVRRPVITNSYDDVVAFTGDNYSYIRGGLVLHMLRKYFGDEKWKQVIQCYVKSNAGRLVTTQDFLNAVEETTGEPMDWFFDQWLYRMGHPVFEVQKNYDVAKRQLAVTVKQVQTIDSNSHYPQTIFFKGKVEIEIDHRVETVWLEAKQENVFVFDLVQEPKLVNFDCGSTWIKEMQFEKSEEELLYQLRYSKDVADRRWAMDKLVLIAKNEKTSVTDREKIYTALKETASGNTYWRFRSYALVQLQGLLVKGNKPVTLDTETTNLLLAIIRNEKAWLKNTAINLLGNTRDEKYADLYISCLTDSSERVINAAAMALAKTKSPKAFEVLKKLKDKPSWKNQSLITVLYALKELGDERGVDIALKALMDSESPHWTLATPVWDHRLAAAYTLVALGKASKGYHTILTQFKRAMQENNINDIFYNTMQVSILADPRGAEIFPLLKEKFKDDANAMSAVAQYEHQFNEATKK